MKSASRRAASAVLGAAAILSIGTASAWSPSTVDNGRGLADSCASFIAASTATPPPGLQMDDLLVFGVSSGLCPGFIKGFRSAMGYAASRDLPPTYCIPSGVSDLQIARVLVKAVNDHPAHEHLPAGPALMAVLAGTWPCPGN